MNDAPASTPDDPPWLDADEQVAWRGFLHMHRQVMGHLNRHFLAESGISSTEFAVLVEISEGPEGAIRFRDLARQLQWDSPRLSHQLRRMDARGFVIRGKVPGDARGMMVSLTPLGHDTLTLASASHVGEVRRIFVDVLDDDQLSAFTAIATRVGENFALLHPDD